MKKIIQEIREQPHHVRQLATVLCTVAVVAVVVLVWFNSFQHDIYALMNPTAEPQAQDQQFATQSKSLFASIFQLFGNTKAQISSFFSGNASQTDVVNKQDQTSQPTTSDTAHPLPVSGNR